MERLVPALFADVTAAIANSQKEVRDRVIGGLVEKEVSKRVETLDKALAALSKLNRELNNAKRPDIEQVTAEGEKVFAFSKDKWNNKGKLEERVVQLENAIEVALNDNKFDKLNEVMAKVSASDKGE